MTMIQHLVTTRFPPSCLTPVSSVNPDYSHSWGRKLTQGGVKHLDREHADGRCRRGPEPLAPLLAAPRNLNWNQGDPKCMQGTCVLRGESLGSGRTKEEKNGAMAKEKDATLKLQEKA